MENALRRQRLFTISGMTCERERPWMKKLLSRHIGLADEPGTRTPSLQDCIELVLEASEPLMQEVLDGLAGASTQTPSPVRYGEHAPVNRAAVDFLYSQAGPAKKTFAAQLRRQVYQPAAQEQAQSAPVRFDDLQWFDGAQIDATIELALAQQEVSRSVDDVLPALNALVSSLLGWTTVQPSLNPLKPQAFVQALHAMLDKHAPDAAARAALMPSAASLMGVGLRQLYRESTGWLRSHGVEPAAPLASGSGAQEAGVATDTQSPLGRRLLSLDKLRQLLAGDLDAPAGPPGFLHTMPASFMAMEDLKLIEPMIRRLANRVAQAGPSVSPPAQVRSAGAQPATPGQQLGQQLGAEVVRMMLEQLTQDRRMLAPVRTLIKSLEPMLLTLTQTDPRFFSDRQHPARQLLERLTNQSLAYRADSEAGFAPFLQAGTRAVASIRQGTGDAANFAQALQALEQDWARQDAAQRVQQQEAALTLLHAEQRNLLAQRWAGDFQARLTGKGLPDWLSDVLCGPWAQAVAQAELACTDGRADPGGYVALVDDLLWSVQPELTRRYRARLVQLVPDILLKLRQGLQSVHYPADALAELFDALIAVHEQAFDGPRAQGLPEPVVHEGPVAKAPPAVEFWLAGAEAQESGFMSDELLKGEAAPASPWSARDLQLGVWVDLRVQGHWLRARLNWVSPHRTLFMFVAAGGSAHSMTRRILERLRRQGRIRVISDGPLVEQALDEVAQTVLKNDLASGLKPP